jgi:hypothetical protein
LSVFTFREEDAEIYQERKNLGRLICQQFLAIEQDTDNTVFLYSKYG